MARLWPDVLRDDVTVVESSSGRKKLTLSSLGDSGEKDGNEVSDLSDGATEEAELEGCEVSFLRVRAPDRWLLIEVPDCCEMERSRGAEGAADVVSMLSCQYLASPWIAWSGGLVLWRQQQRGRGRMRFRFCLD
jgi:hypothetical protein